MRNPWLVSALSLVLVGSPALAGENDGPAQSEDPPSMRAGGKGKGKGKGKGRVPMNETPAANPSPAPPPAASSGSRLFEDQIRPVLEEHCLNCHQTGRKMKGGLAVDSLAALLRGGDSGPAIEPGHADKSPLYTSITYTDPDCQMPPREQLSSHVVAAFRQWIEAGAAFSDAAPTAVDSPSAAAGSAEQVVTLTAIRGNTLTFIPSAGGPGMARGGRFRGGDSGDSQSLPLADNAVITAASTERRTGRILIGIDLADGLHNEVFSALSQGGMSVRMVTRDETIVELNVVTGTSDDAPIAVKPIRPRQLP